MAQNARLSAAIHAASTRPGTQYTLPGFGPAVYTFDVDAWIDCFAPHISAPRREKYARDWAVAEKIARLKTSGDWADYFQPPAAR